MTTIAVCAYEKAQVMRSLLESHGIEVFMQSTDPLLPAMSARTKVSIRKSDEKKAASILEENQSDKTEGKNETEQKKNLLLPVDFSEYSIRLCEFGFRLAKILKMRAVLFHTYSVQKNVLSSISDVYVTKKDEENIRQKENECLMNMDALKTLIDKAVEEGEMPSVEYNCVLREGIPEECILEYAKETHPYAIVMGTRGRSRKDMDMIGSVTAEVMERSSVPVFTVPENPHFLKLENIRQIACSSNFEDCDVETYKELLEIFNNIGMTNMTFHFIHFDSEDDSWAEMKLRGMKSYYMEQFPNMRIEYHLLKGKDILTAYDAFIKTYEIDVISLVTHRRNLLRRMFNPSMASKIVFHTNTPMMVFHL